MLAMELLPANNQRDFLFFGLLVFCHFAGVFNGNGTAVRVLAFTDTSCTGTIKGMDMRYRVPDGDVAAGRRSTWIILRKYDASTAANSSSGTATRSMYGTTLDYDVTAGFIVSNVVTTATDACSILMPKGIQRTVARNGKGTGRRYKDTGMAGTEAFDIVRTSDDESGVA